MAQLSFSAQGLISWPTRRLHRRQPDSRNLQHLLTGWEELEGTENCQRSSYAAAFKGTYMNVIYRVQVQYGDADARHVTVALFDASGSERPQPTLTVKDLLGRRTGFCLCDLSLGVEREGQQDWTQAFHVAGIFGVPGPVLVHS